MQCDPASLLTTVPDADAPGCLRTTRPSPLPATSRDQPAVPVVTTSYTKRAPPPHTHLSLCQTIRRHLASYSEGLMK